nr:zinc finger, CCHC-type [Tanacetum cinerariifolium]
MRDENPISTRGDYSKPTHEGYVNTIELPIGNNVIPLLSDTSRLVQNGCSFHRLRSEDPNQHLKDFLKLQQSEMTYKIDTVLKAIIDRIAGALPSDTVKNTKLSTSLVFDSYEEKAKEDKVKEVIDEEESEVGTDEEIEEILKDKEEEEEDEDGSFSYECNFMILEDTISIIDRHLEEMDFGRPFIDETALVCNKEKGTVMFKQNDKKITF